MKIKRERPFSTTRLTASLKADLERFSKEDGIQRGAFFDTSGKFRTEQVSVTSLHPWLFKTKAGVPLKGQHMV